MDNTELLQRFYDLQRQLLHLPPQRDARKQPPTEQYLRKRQCQHSRELRFPNLAAPLSNYCACTETLRGPFYPCHTKVRQGIVRGESAIEAPDTECTFPLEVHSEAEVLTLGDAQRKPSNREMCEALDYRRGLCVGHQGSCPRAECSLAAAPRNGRHYVESVKKRYVAIQGK